MSKKPTLNQMVARESFLRTLRQLRKDEECLLQQPLHEVRGQAAQADADGQVEGLASTGDLNFTEYLTSAVIGRGGRSSGASSEFVTTPEKSVNEIPAGVIPALRPLSHELRERLLGKSPLRLVMARSPQYLPPSTTPKYWIETLACGHSTVAYPLFYWDETGHPINSIPTAKRRRCQDCRAIELAALPPKKPVQSVREIPDKKAAEK